MKFGAAEIRQLRREMGFTQRDFSIFMDVDPGTVSRWERGVSQPQPFMQQRLESARATHKLRKLQRQLAAMKEHYRKKLGK